VTILASLAVRTTSPCCSPMRGCSKLARRAGPSASYSTPLRVVVLNSGALDVLQVQPRSLGSIGRQTHDVRFDHDPPRVGSVQFDKGTCGWSARARHVRAQGGTRPRCDAAPKLARDFAR